MVGFLLAFVLILIVIMIIIETVTVRFVYTNEFLIKIDFLLFELILYPSRKAKKNRKKRGLISGIKRSFLRAAATKNAVEYLLSHSNVTVRELALVRNTQDPAELALSMQQAYALITVIITYLSLKTNTIIDTHTNLTSLNEIENNTNVTLDVSVSSTLFRVAFAFIVFIVSTYGYKRKRGRRIG